MKSSFNVNVSEDSLIEFPDICPICGMSCTVNNLKLSETSLGYSGAVNNLFSSKRSVLVPAHRTCVKIQRRRSLLRTMALGSGGLIVAIVSNYYSFSKIESYVLLLLALILFAVWYSFRPLPIEFTKKDGVMCFEFKRRSYAKKFAALNGSVVDD